MKADNLFLLGIPSLAVALPAVPRADPDAVIIAPAVNRMAFEFLEACFELGLLDLLDVSNAGLNR